MYTTEKTDSEKNNLTLNRKSPTVSIILCNYNDARYLNESLTAICEQTHPADEIIVLDDGSTDNSIEIIQQFQNRYAQIILLRNETNKGLLYSINYALQVAKCDFIVWAAADDKLLPHFLERNIACLNQYPHAHLVFSRLSTFQDGTLVTKDYTAEVNGIAFDYSNKEHYISPKQLINRLKKNYFWISGNTVLARRAILLELGGFDSRLKWHADWYTFYALAIKHGACVIPDTLAQLRERPNTYSQAGTKNPVEQKEVLKNILLAIMHDEQMYKTVLKCPAILSIYEMKILDALPIKFKSIPLFFIYFPWYLIFYKQYPKRIVMKAARMLGIVKTAKIVKKFLMSKVS